MQSGFIGNAWMYTAALFCPWERTKLPQVVVRFDQNETRRIANEVAQPVAMAGSECDQNAIARLRDPGEPRENLRVSQYQYPLRSAPGCVLLSPSGNIA